VRCTGFARTFVLIPVKVGKGVLEESVEMYNKIATKKVGLTFLVVILLAVCATMVAAEQKEVYVLLLEYDLNKEELFVTKGYFFEPRSQPEQGYRIDIVADSKLLYSENFVFSREIFFAPQMSDEQDNNVFTETGPIILDVVTKELILPYFDEARMFKLYSPQNEMVLEYDVSYLSSVSTQEKLTDKRQKEIKPEKLEIISKELVRRKSLVGRAFLDIQSKEPTFWQKLTKWISSLFK